MDPFPARLEGVRLEANGHRLLDNISAELARVPVTALLGPNGAGKSLLLRICRGLLAPTRGQILWGRRTPQELGARIGYIPQHPVMLRRSVGANIAYAVRHCGIDRRERSQAVDTILEQMHLTRLRAANAHTLSGGERQRVAIARAWSQRPAALLLDEPAAHLDPAAAAAVEQAIRTIRDAGTRIVLCTHDLHQARRLAHEIVFLHRGQLLEQAPGHEFFDHPKTAEAARFLAGDLLA